jgi:hypothetical protein
MRNYRIWSILWLKQSLIFKINNLRMRLWLRIRDRDRTAESGFTISHMSDKLFVKKMTKFHHGLKANKIDIPNRVYQEIDHMKNQSKVTMIDDDRMKIKSKMSQDQMIHLSFQWKMTIDYVGKYSNLHRNSLQKAAVSMLIIVVKPLTDEWSCMQGGYDQYIGAITCSLFFQSCRNQISHAVKSRLFLWGSAARSILAIPMPKSYFCF